MDRSIKNHAAMVFFIALVAILLFGCGTARRYVVAYVSVDQIYSEPILKAFEKETGIEVRAVYDVEASKTTGLATRLIAERNSPRADIFWNGEFAQTLRLKASGILQTCAPAVASDIPATFKDPEGYWYGIGGRARVFLINRNLLRPDAYPRKLQDFLNPKYPPDRIGMALPLFGTSATHAAALFAVMGQESAGRFYSELKNRGIRLVDGNSVVRDLVVSGHLIFGLTDTDDALGAVEKGAPVEVVAPDQDEKGTLVVPGTAALIRGAPHAKEADKLMNYLLKGETEQSLIRSGFCQWSVRGNTGSSPMFPSGLKAMPISLGDVDRLLPQVMIQMREIFSR